MPADILGLQSHLEVPSGGRETTWKPFSVPERFRDDPATDMKQTSPETGDSTALGCRALQHKTDRDWGLAVCILGRAASARLGVHTPLCCQFPVWLWASPFPTLGLGSVICEVRVLNQKLSKMILALASYVYENFLGGLGTWDRA